MPGKCPGCQKATFPAEKPIKACGGEWHPVCLKCTQCKIQLNLNTLLSYQNTPYCKVHLPKDRPTQIADGLATKQALSAPKTTAVQGVEKTQTTTFPPKGTPPMKGAPLAPGRAPPMKGAPVKAAPVRAGPPSGGAPPARQWKVESQIPGRVPPPGPGPVQRPPAVKNAPTPAVKNAPAPARNVAPSPARNVAPAGPPAKKWDIGVQNTVPHNPGTFKPSSDPSKAAPNMVQSQPVSKTPFKQTVAHKTEMKSVNAMPQKEVSSMQKTTNVGRQPVGLMYSSSDSEDEERESMRNQFKMQNYHAGGSDQSTENAPESSTITYEGRSHDQSTENNPTQSSISYDRHNGDQSTESNPQTSKYSYNNQGSTGFSAPKKAFGGSAPVAPPVQQETSYDNSYDQGADQSYDQGADQSYDNTGADQGYTETSYDNTGADQNYDQGAEQSYDQAAEGGYDQSYDQAAEGGYDQSYDQGAEGGYDQSYDQGAEQSYEQGAEGGYDQSYEGGEGYDQSYEGGENYDQGYEENNGGW